MQESKYFFILGRNPALSLAELRATLPKDCQITSFSSEAVITQCQPLNISRLMQRLGGIIKIGAVAEAEAAGSPKRLIEKIRSLLPKKNGKIFFGLSVYALDKNVPILSAHESRILGLAIKRILQEEKNKTRLVTSRQRALSSVVVKTNHLLDRGAEICLFFAQDKIYLGKTLAVQQFEEASFRDFGRPAREMRVGMLPIQLAKIMINLADQPLEAKILDPFCGFGTILAEAALMGHKNLIGSDINRQAVEDTKQNLEWLNKNYELGIRNYKLFQSDVKNLSKKLPPSSISAVVTEPYLGPTRGISNYEKGIRNLIDELSQLYFAAFQEFKKILRPNGFVVFVFPAFKTGGQIKKISEIALPKIKNIGFEPLRLLPQNISTYYSLPTAYSIVYSRPSQKVLREIFVFRMK